jgi:multiple sugar transport system substrate-binding protein
VCIRAWWPVVVLLAFASAAACGRSRGEATLTVSGSGLGLEGRVLRAQLARFAAQRPQARVELQVTPDAADQRHQLYVQWLNARAADPDVLQLDIIWTAEFAAAGWIQPVPSALAREDAYFPAAIAANRWRGRLYALPWFVDAGLLYWRTDLVAAAPRSLEDLHRSARSAARAHGLPYGLVWQGARYEGLVTVFLEHAAAFGGGILDARGRVIVDAPEAIRALTFMRDAVAEGAVPREALGWQEEQVRFAFQNGRAVFMRNWPYAWALLQDESASRVAGRTAIAPFPAARGGRPAAALGGAQLAVNAHSDAPDLAWALVAFLTEPAQMIERARVAAQLPSRPDLYATAELAAALPLPLDEVRRALDAAVPRPATPVYSELSELLQVRLHRALTGQQDPAPALRDAAREIRTLFERTGLAAADTR